MILLALDDRLAGEPDGSPLVRDHGSDRGDEPLFAVRLRRTTHPQSQKYWPCAWAFLRRLMLAGSNSNSTPKGGRAERHVGAEPLDHAA